MSFTTPIRETENFKLYKGFSAGHAVLRKSDNKVTLWNTGCEGEEWANELTNLSDKEFDVECEEMEFV